MVSNGPVTSLNRNLLVCLALFTVSFKGFHQSLASEKIKSHLCIIQRSFVGKSVEMAPIRQYPILAQLTVVMRLREAMLYRNIQYRSPVQTQTLLSASPSFLRWFREKATPTF